MEGPTAGSARPDKDRAPECYMSLKESPAGGSSSNGKGLPPGFISAKQTFRANLNRRPEMIECLDEHIVRWAERLHRMAYFPGAMYDVYVQGYENFPERKDSAPIVAIAHKKLHDVFAALAFMAGRPLERSHDITLVAQAGLFYGIYTYRDLVPELLKRGPFVRPLAAFSRLAGRLTNRFARSFHANPVFREGVDLPPEDIYYDHIFAGPHVMKMDYSEFLRHAGRTTMSSVVAVQKELIELNRSFVIFPEGKYCHDGGIAEMQDLAGIVALRKERPLVPVSLTYDELCTDRFGRITAWLKVSEPIPHPTDKRQLPEYLHHLRDTLQKSSIITASHLIASALQHIRLTEQTSFDLADFKKRYEDYCLAAVESGFAIDERLRDETFRHHQLGSFLRRKGKRWLRREGHRYYLCEKSISKFAESERTVDDIAWNANNIRHLTLK